MRTVRYWLTVTVTTGVRSFTAASSQWATRKVNSIKEYDTLSASWPECSCIDRSRTLEARMCHWWRVNTAHFRTSKAAWYRQMSLTKKALWIYVSLHKKNTFFFKITSLVYLLDKTQGWKKAFSSTNNMKEDFFSTHFLLCVCVSLSLSFSFSLVR